MLASFIFTLFSFFREVKEEDDYQNSINDEQLSDDDSDQFATIKRCPKDVDKKTTSTPTTPQEINKNTIVSEHITEQQFVDEMIYGEVVENIKARALYDYQAGLFYKF